MLGLGCKYSHIYLLKGGVYRMKSILNKKGQLSGLSGSILALILAAIFLVLGLVISQELRDTQTTGTEAYNAANDTVVGLGTFGDFWEIIVLAVVAAVVIGILIASFGGKGGVRAR